MASETPKSIQISTGTLLRIILFGLLIAMIIALGELVLVILTAVVIASFVESGVQHLKRLRIPRSVSVIGIYIFTIAALATFFYLLVPTFLVELSSLAGLLSGYLPESSAIQFLQGDTLREAREILRTLSAEGSSITDVISNAEGFLSSISAGFFQTVSTIFGGIVNLILIFIISFYLSMQEGGIEHFLRIVTPRKHETYAIDLWHRTRKKISLWVQGQLLLGLIVGGLTFLGLTLLGVEYALFIAAFTAVLELIPYGILVAIIPALSFAFLDGGLTLAIMVGIMYILIQQLENYFIAPMVVNKVVGISPLVVILAVLIGVTLAGFWGLILAIPISVALLEFLTDYEHDRVYTTDNEKVV